MKNKSFLFSFTGRERGAIGIMQKFEIIIVAESEKQARLKIYDSHEHIADLKIKIIK